VRNFALRKAPDLRKILRRSFDAPILIKERDIKMTLDGAEFELPGWVKGELKTEVGMEGN
jgi:hypothetical protein